MDEQDVETYDLTETEQEKLESTQQAVEQAQMLLQQEQAHAQDVWELIAEGKGIDAEPDEVRFQDGALIVSQPE